MKLSPDRAHRRNPVRRQLLSEQPGRLLHQRVRVASRYRACSPLVVVAIPGHENRELSECLPRRQRAARSLAGAGGRVVCCSGAAVGVAAVLPAASAGSGQRVGWFPAATGNHPIPHCASRHASEPDGAKGHSRDSCGRLPTSVTYLAGAVDSLPCPDSYDHCRTGAEQWLLPAQVPEKGSSAAASASFPAGEAGPSPAGR